MKIVRRTLWILIAILIVMLFLKPKEKEILLADGTYENCYVIILKDDLMDVLADGSRIKIPCPVEENIEKKDKIADIQVKDNQIVKITWKEGLVEDKVDSLNLTEGWINLSSYGRKNISLSGEMYIKTGEEVRLLQKAGSLLNRDKISCYIYNDEICAVIVEGEESLQSIRVLLHGEIDGIFHEEVRLTGTKPFKISMDGEEMECAAGELVGFTKDMGVARIECPEGKIKILSMERADGYPEYRGGILVYSYEEGFLIRNELKLEEYLYSVVSSEMPASYPDEALKAQAVCARTYAIYQMEQAYYGEYGAHVDDTVNSQVYNNVAETESTIQAVNETTGQYLSYENSPICAYFYSTSCGTTSDVKDVWISEGDSPVYLNGRYQGEPEKEADYSDENVFYEFISSNQPECFENQEAWFRWSTNIDFETLTKHVNEHVKEWVKASPSQYQLNLNEQPILNEQTSQNSQMMNEDEQQNQEKEILGRIQKVQVESRSIGGVIKRLSLIGEKGTLAVTGEYQIRKVLCPEGTKLTLKDGSTKQCSMLPSGYFSVENGETLKITGGGYGHGVGMSQNGAMALAELNKNYEEILGFYYPKTEILEVY